MIFFLKKTNSYLWNKCILFSIEHTINDRCYILRLFSFLLTAASVFFGYEFVTYFIGRSFDWLIRLGIGSPLGIIISAWIFFITQYWIPFSFIHGLTVIILIFIVALLFHMKNSTIKTPTLRLSIYPIIFGIVAPFILMTFLMYFGFLYKEFYTKGACYGDFPFHLNLISSFAYGCNMKRSSFFGLVTPFYSGEKLAYPFISNFYSAVLIACFKSSYHSAFVIPSIPVVFSVFVVLTYISDMFSHSSVPVSSMTSFLYLLSGGLGFTRFWKYFTLILFIIGLMVGMNIGLVKYFMY